MSGPSKTFEQYALVFVDKAGVVVGYLDRARKQVVAERERAYEFDEDTNATRVVADATRALYGDNPFPSDPQTFIEIRELWELSGGPE